MPDHEELVRFERESPERLSYRADTVSDFGTRSSESYSYLRVYWQILRKRRWTVATVAFVLTTLVAIVSFKTQPIYEATAQVEVEAEPPQIQSLNDLYRSIPSDDAFLQTQVKVLKSDNLAWRTIQQLGLGETPVFTSPGKRDGQRVVDSPTTEQIRLIRVFRQRLRVELARNSRIVEVGFESVDPNLAARVTNALVNNYAEYNFSKKYDATRQASGWMEQQLDELKAKVEKSQLAMVDYERQNTIVNVGEKQNVVEQRLAGLSQDLTNAQGDRMQKESLYQLVSSNESQVAFIGQNDLLQRLEEKHADLKGQYLDVLGQYGPNFPKVVRLRTQVDEVQSLIERERKRIVMRIRNDYLAALGRERLLSAAVAQAKVEVGKLNQLLIQHNMLKREFETNQQLYENLLQHLKDATVTAGLKATNVHVLDMALPPPVPVRPRKLYNIAIGLMVGLILGVTLAFVRESLDTSVKGAEDVGRLLGTPVLAVIPKGGPIWSRSRGNKSQAESRSVDLTVLQHPASSLAESFRTLRTSVLLSTAPRPPQALLVTSSQPKEGKTCTALNLATALAQRSVRVLIIDADLRRGEIAATLGLPQDKGLSSFLSGAHSLDEVLMQSAVLSDLWVLPAGPCPPNPADLLSSPSMEKLLGELRQRFDHLVLDSPPLLLVTDATILSTLVDGILLVVESGVTPRGAVVRSHQILESAGGKILGTVVNKLDVRHDGYYGHYGSYYGGYYRSTAPAKHDDVRI